MCAEKIKEMYYVTGETEIAREKYSMWIKQEV